MSTEDNKESVKDEDVVANDNADDRQGDPAEKSANKSDDKPAEKRDEKPADKQDASDDIAKLSEVARKERELRKAAERKLSEFEKGKMSVEERIAQLEKQNQEQALQLKRDALVKDLSSGVEKGFKVDLAKVDEILSMAALSNDNVEDVVKRAVKLATSPDTALDVPENKQSRSDSYAPEDAMKLKIADVF